MKQCQSLIDEMLASHSTDLQQRAYELQAIVNLDARGLKEIMPMDSTSEEVEVIVFVQNKLLDYVWIDEFEI